MYVYHQYFSAKRVALIYPSSDEKTTVKRGEFLAIDKKMTKENLVGDGNICSVISLKTNSELKIGKNIFMKLYLHLLLKPIKKLNIYNKKC